MCYDCILDWLSKLSLAGKRVVRFPTVSRRLETMTSARFLNGRFWKQTEGETRCHRGDVAFFPEIGSRDRTRKCSTRKDAVRCPPLVIVLVRPIADCIISCSYSLLRRSTQREQNRMPRSRRSKMLPVLNTLRCAYDYARTFDENEIRYEYMS